MSKSLVVNGYTYQYPSNKESPGWGEEASSWAEAITSAVAETSGLGDIAQMSAAISGTSQTNEPIVGFTFDPLVVRSAVCEYSIYRTSTGGGAEERLEQGTIYLGYKTTAGTWDITVVGGGSSGVTLSISSGGQVLYSCDALTGTPDIGVIKFRARALII